MQCATGWPLRSFELSSISSMSKDALCKSPIMSLIEFSIIEVVEVGVEVPLAVALDAVVSLASVISSSLTLSHKLKQSINFPRTSFPGTEFT